MSYLINGEAAGAPKVELDYTGDHYNLILTPLAASGLMPAATPSPQVYTSTVAPLTQLQQRLEDQEQAAYKSGQGLSAQDLALQTVIEHYKKLRTPLSLQQEEWKEKILTAIRTQVVESQSSIPPHLITVEQPMLIKGELRTCTITLPSHRALKRPTYALLEGDAYTFQYEAPDALDAEKAGEVTLTVNDWDPIPVYRRSKLVLPMAPPPSVKQGEGDGHGPAPEGGQGPTTAPNLGTSNPAPSFSQHPHGGDSPAAEHVDSQGDLGESLNSPSYGMAHDLDKKGDTAPLSYNPSDTSFFSNSLYYCGWALKLMISFSPFQNNPNTSRKWASEKIRV